MKLKVRDLLLYAEAGWTIADVAAAAGVTPQSVSMACVKHNIKLTRAIRSAINDSPEREAVIMQSVTESWTLQELGDKLGITRERARQLLKKRGLDKIRVRWAGLNAHSEPKEKPIRHCRLEDCEQIILAPHRWRFCSDGCSETWERRYCAERNNARYHADPAFKERQAKWQRDNPDKTAAMQKRYLATVGGQLHYKAHLEKLKADYTKEPKIKMQCLDCGTQVERKLRVAKLSQRQGRRSPLCNDCQANAALAARGVSRAG